MESLISVWAKLDARKRIIVIAATLAVFGAVLLLTRGAANRDMALLYAGLDASSAGEVVTSLDQRGVQYEVRGSSLFVPTTDRDRLRMTLAAEGLPANNAQGYELLDNLSGFGTTSQMFDAAYWRAKEGELARTMLASPHIRAARVHISSQSSQPFRREQEPTAAVTVTTALGALDVSQADALRFLVASSVPGLSPQNVAVIDGVGGLVSNSQEQDFGRSADERAAEMRARVERILVAHVGAGNAVVELSLDTVTETESILERRIDPDSRVPISTEVEESSSKSEDSSSGDVTVASNLPEGDAAGSGGNSTNQNADSRTITNFEISETQREILRTPGAVKRLTVAVLVNTVQAVNDTGDTIEVPRSEEELADLERLVASAIGFDAERGDEITIRSMPFEPVDAGGTDAGDASLPAAPLDMMRLIQTGVLAIVALVLGLFVVRPILSGRKTPSAELDNSLPPAADGQIANSENVQPQALSGVQAVPALEAPDSESEQEATKDPVDRLRDMIDERRDEALQVLQSWVDEPQNGGTA